MALAASLRALATSAASDLGAMPQVRGQERFKRALTLTSNHIEWNRHGIAWISMRPGLGAVRWSWIPKSARWSANCPARKRAGSDERY
jgi:hypothetical protein